VATPSADQDRLHTSVRDPHLSSRDLCTNTRSPPRPPEPPPELLLSSLPSPRAKVYPALRLPPAEETNATDITGGTCLLYNDRPPLRYG
jgi:hypothetical protein